MTPDKLHSEISQGAQSVVKRKNLTPSVGNWVEHFSGILTSVFQVFLFLFIDLFFMQSSFSNFVFRVLVFWCSGIPCFSKFYLPLVGMNRGSQVQNKHFIEEAIFDINNRSSRIAFCCTFWRKYCSLCKYQVYN